MSKFQQKTQILQRFPRACLAIALVCLSAPLAGCGVDRTVTGSIVDDDVRVRHPIVLTKAATNLDIFAPANHAGLDTVSKGQVREFAQAYRTHGEGQITVLVPAGGASAADAHQSVEAIRHELSAGGARGFISVGSYPVADPSLASPVRLTFHELKAKVATNCGEWPADLASGSSVEGWNNRPYWNFGCAYQSALATQIADPRDLVGPRAETPADTAERTRAISNVRKGGDPGTSWLTKNSAISQIGN